MLRVIIISGIILFIVGVYADYALASWSGAALISGTVITYAGVLLWMLSAENRRRLMQRVPILSSTNIGGVTISGYTKDEIRAIHRSGAPYYSVMSFCFLMALLHVMTFFIHKSALYQTAVESVKTNEAIMTTLGEVKGYSYTAVGVIHDAGRSNLIYGIRGTSGTYWVQAIFNGVDNVQTLEEITPIVSADALVGK